MIRKCSVVLSEDQEVGPLELAKTTGVHLDVHEDGNASGKVSSADLPALKELIEAGRLRPVIDRVYPLEQIVEAHRYVDHGHKGGNVVNTVGQTDLTTQEKPS